MTTMNAAAEAVDLPPPRRFGTILVARPQSQRPSGTFRSITLRVGRKCTHTTMRALDGTVLIDTLLTLHDA
jgi:hypothetical protein